MLFQKRFRVLYYTKRSNNTLYATLSYIDLAHPIWQENNDFESPTNAKSESDDIDTVLLYIN